MPLSVGTRFGPYEIVAPLGTGGMGEVYRSRDTRLDRTVAIKVLPTSLADDPDLRQRQYREARAISQLTHPNICTLYDIGVHEGIVFLVMEFLDGETIAERLARGTAGKPAFTLGEAIGIALQIAEALTVAHRQRIVHRDLKPGNVMLTKTGATHPGSPQVKLFDFGLAKTAAPVVLTGASQLVTTPPQPVTAQGTILGTFNYMAPEQVEGGEADARTDIFAFGCVLYEMLTGEKAFEGKTPASLIAAILEREPRPLATLQPLAPRLLDSIVRRCVAKDPDDRWQSAADLATALKWASDAPATTSIHVQPGSPPGVAHPGARGLAVAALALIVAASAGVLAWRYLAGDPPSSDREIVQFEVLPPPDSMWSPAPVGSMAQVALSPDGRRMAFVAALRRGVSQVWVRSLDTVHARPLAGTDGASFPFWSPDSRHVAFFAGGKLKKVDTEGGTPQPLGDAASGRGGSWSPSGDIIFTSSPNGPLSRISAAGGAVTKVSVLDPAQGAITHYWPRFLSDGRRFLYYQRSAKPEHQGIYVSSLDSAAATRVIASDGMAVPVPGYLLLVRDGMLFAHVFDERTLEASGDPIRIADNVGYFGGTLGFTSATASTTGSIAYGPRVVLATNLQWHDRGGSVSAGPAPPGSYRSPRLSPDQKRVAAAVVDTSSSPDVLLLELARGTIARVTSHAANDWFPVWAPDGNRLFFASTRMGSSSIFQRPANGISPEEPMTEALFTGVYPTDVSSDGHLLIYHQVAPAGYDLGVFDTASRTRSAFLAGTFNEVQASFSPNGRWTAYASDESGRFEVYVRPFPSGNGLSTISVAGGMQPQWRRDGRELFYVAPDGTIMAVDVTTDLPNFDAGIPHALFKAEMPEANAPYPTDFTVTANGQRFLVNTVLEQSIKPTLTVLLNWTDGLKR